MDEPIVFTVGYEGQREVKSFLKRLIDNYKVKAIVDVRRNPISRKNGFDCFGLNMACDDLNVPYYILSELGVPKEYRSKLEQYDYKNKVLQSKALSILQNIIEGYKRVILLCYEKDHNICHRSILADLLKESYGYDIEHIILR